MSTYIFLSPRYTARGDNFSQSKIALIFQGQSVAMPSKSPSGSVGFVLSVYVRIYLSIFYQFHLQRNWRRQRLWYLQTRKGEELVLFIRHIKELYQAMIDKVLRIRQFKQCATVRANNPIFFHFNLLKIIRAPSDPWRVRGGLSFILLENKVIYPHYNVYAYLYSPFSEYPEQYTR